MANDMKAADGAGGSLFQTVLGDRFADLPRAVQRFHTHLGKAHYEGKADIAGPEGLTGKFAAWIAGFPPPGRDVPVRVTIDASPELELWERHFGDKRFTSRLVLDRSGQFAEEHVGAFHFTLELHVTDGKLAFPVRSGRLFGWLPIPLALLPQSQSFECEDAQGRFTFDIVVTLRGRRIAAYRGHLEPVAAH